MKPLVQTPVLKGSGGERSKRGKGQVAHACNPSYSGSFFLPWANSSGDPILKNTITIKGLLKWLNM
jgi:hypothetical protein